MPYASGPMDERQKRLAFRAWRRGFREIDLVLGRFADARLPGLDEAALAEFERLLGAPDQAVYAWIVEAEPPPPEFDTPLLALIRAFTYLNRPPANGPDSETQP